MWVTCEYDGRSTPEIILIKWALRKRDRVLLEVREMLMLALKKSVACCETEMALGRTTQQDLQEPLRAKRCWSDIRKESRGLSLTAARSWIQSRSCEFILTSVDILISVWWVLGQKFCYAVSSCNKWILLQAAKFVVLFSAGREN